MTDAALRTNVRFSLIDLELVTSKLSEAVILPSKGLGMAILKSPLKVRPFENDARRDF